MKRIAPSLLTLALLTVAAAGCADQEANASKAGGGAWTAADAAASASDSGAMAYDTSTGKDSSGGWQSGQDTASADYVSYLDTMADSSAADSLQADSGGGSWDAAAAEDASSGPADAAADTSGPADANPGGTVDDQTLQQWTMLSENAQFAQVSMGPGQFLKLVDMRVTVHIEGLRVRTLVDHIYKNEGTSTVQGKFRYALPADASISYYAMFSGQPNITPEFFGPQSQLLGKDDETIAATKPEEVALSPDPAQWGKLMEAKVAEQVKATIAYETEVNKQIDPSLVEYVGPNTFEAKVYPILPKGYNRVLVAYEQTLPRIDGKLRLTMPLPKVDPAKPLPGDIQNTLAGKYDLTVVAKKSAASELAYVGTAANVSAKEGKAASIYKLTFGGAAPGGVLAWNVVPAQGTAEADVLAGTDKTLAKDYALIRVQPSLTGLTGPKAYAKHAVFLLDTSRSELQRFSKSLKLLEAILEQSPGIEQFAVLSFDAGARWLKPSWTVNDAAGRASVPVALNGVILEGASDLGSALRALAMPPAGLASADKQLDVFLLSDGSLNWGETAPETLVAEFTAQAPWQARFFSYRLGIGGDNPQLYQALTKSGGAVFNCEAAALQACGTAHQAAGLLLKSVTVVGSGDQPAQPADVVVAGSQATLFPGGSLNLALRLLAPGQAKVVLQGVVPGQGPLTVEVPVVLQPSGELAPRAWAEIAVEQLLQGHKAELDVYAVALSQHFRILSPVASFLVLEDEKAYIKYGIDTIVSKLAGKGVAELVLAAQQAAGQVWSSWLQIDKVLKDFQAKSLLVGLNGGVYKSLVEVVPETELQVPASFLQIPLYYAKDAPAAYLELVKETKTDAFGVKPWYDEAERRRNEGQLGAAVRALSTVVEERPQDAESARLVGYRLRSWDQGEQAAHLLLGVLKKRPFEPQSYRDLAGVVAEQRPMLAAILYEATLAGNWDAKFKTLKVVAAEEYALLIAAAQTQLKPAAAQLLLQRQKQLGLKLPTGKLRVTLTWNTDNTDIDLWIIDPMGQKCFYANKKLASGGQLLDDLTQGYGPERFEAQKIIPGTYTIQAHYYANNGQANSQATYVSGVIITDVGQPNQFVQQMTTVLEAKGNVVTLGTATFK